ncbi:MAG: hypothetical protein WA093_02360 [Minisyncoccales bacterium]
MKNDNFSRKGIIITYVLVFGAVFLLMLAGLFGYILLQLRQSLQRVASSEALNIAEAGIDYYRWCANNEVQDDCAKGADYYYDYYDGNGVLAGEFSIIASSTLSCGKTSQLQITAIGRTRQFPGLERKVRITYGRESVAKYSYILNSSVWIGGDHEINGPYHSNGGIRMDGQNQSLMTSAVLTTLNGTTTAEWICDGAYGCGLTACSAWITDDCCPLSRGCRISAGKCICPGIFTTTANSTPSLFKFPVPPFPFDAITMDLGDIKKAAKTGGGIYFSPSLDEVPGSKGYHLVFLNNGTVRVSTVRSLHPVNGYNSEEGWHQDRFIISNEDTYTKDHADGIYPIPADCSAIYVEDNLWVEGTVKGKVVVASAHLKDPGDTDPDIDTDVVFPGNITYSSYGGSDGLAVIAENNALISPASPEDMDLHAIIVAQKGRFGRNHYTDWAYRDRGILSIYGSVISKGRVGTQWVDTDSGQMLSGYAQRYTYFDQNQVYNPPPFVANMSSDYKIVSWQEIN